MKYALMGSLHSETQEPITLAFRWSSFAAFNIPIIIGLSILPPTVKTRIYYIANKSISLSGS